MKINKSKLRKLIENILLEQINNRENYHTLKVSNFDASNSRVNFEGLDGKSGDNYITFSKDFYEKYKIEKGKFKIVGFSSFKYGYIEKGSDTNLESSKKKTNKKGKVIHVGSFSIPPGLNKTTPPLEEKNNDITIVVNLSSPSKLVFSFGSN